MFVFRLIFFEFLLSFAYASIPPTKYSPIYNFRTQIKDVSSTECPPNDRGYTQIEEESNDLPSGNYYICNMKFRNKIVLNQGLLLIYKCNFTCMGSQSIINIQATDDIISKQSIEIHDCFFYQNSHESIHIVSKLPSRQANIVGCSFVKCESSLSAIAIYFEVTSGTIEQCSFINNKAKSGSTATDIHYRYNSCDEIGKVTINDNFIKKNPGTGGNFISFDLDSTFDFKQNTISISESSSSIVFTLPGDITDHTGYNFESNVLYPYNTKVISNLPNNLKDKFIEKDEIECPPNHVPSSPNVPIKSMCDLPFDNTSSPAVHITSSLVSVVYCTFSNNANHKTNKGAAVYIYIDKNMPTYDEPIRVYNSDFFYCDAKYGGAIYIECYQDDLLFDFRDDFFAYDFYKYQDQIDKNDLKGGAILIRTKFSSFSFQRCFFDNNNAGDGGALYFLSDTTDSSAPTNYKNEYFLYLIDCEFNFNQAYSNGAGMFISLIGHEHSVPVQIECCRFYFCFADQIDSGSEAPEHGGAIYYSSSYTTLAESTSDSSFNVINCHFKNCQCSFSGGAIAIFIEKEEPSRSFNIDDCVFYQNRIGETHCFENCGSGNDIYFKFDSTSTKDFQNDNILFFKKCHFTGGSSLSKRGTMISISIMNEEPSKSIEVKDCTFTNNKNSPSPIYYNFYSTSSSQRNLLEGVKCYALHVVDSNFVSNSLDENGGAIGIILENKEPSNPIEITGCIFSSNVALDTNETDEENGGAIYYIDKASSSSNNYLFSIVDSKFSNNQVTFYGGSIYIEIANYEPSYPIEISRCSFENGVAIKYGGFIYYKFNPRSSATSTPSTAHNLYINDCEFTGTDGTQNGGSISILIPNKEPSKPIEINNCTFTHCQCSISGGAISYLNKATTSTSTDYSFNIVDCKFNGNKAINGGAIFIETTNTEPSSRIKISGCSFDKNSAENHESALGASIYCDFLGSTTKEVKSLLEDSPVLLSVTGCNFSENSSPSTYDIYINTDANEKAITIDFTKCTFKDSTPEGMYLSSYSESTFYHINDCDFMTTFNIYFSNDIASGKVENCRFNDMKNTPITYFSDKVQSVSPDHELRIENCVFVQESEIESIVYFKSPLSSQFYFIQNQINITNDKTRALGIKENVTIVKEGWHFEGNTIEHYDFIKTENAEDIPASCKKGFLCNSLPFDCDGGKRCDFDDSKISEMNPSITLSDVHFRLKTHANNGACIHVMNYIIHCSDSTFDQCSSEARGGGIYIYLDKVVESPITLQNLEFKSCEAVCGGAIFVFSDIAENKIEIIKCTFEQNSANASPSSTDDSFFSGSAIFMAALNGRIIRCKFAKNVGTGIKIFNKHEQLQKMIAKSEQTSIKIADCIFETDEKSKSSLFYVRGSKNEIPVEVDRCVFKGKMPDGSYHIDGESIVDTKKPMNIHIKSCQFLSGKESALNKNKSAFLLASFEDKDDDKKINSTYYDAKKVFIIVAGFASIAVLSAIIINFIMKKKKNQASEENNIEL